jgi:hypothetical protein
MLSNRSLFPFGDTDFQYGTDVPYAHSPDEHDFYQFDYPGKASLIGSFMVAYKLTSAVFTTVKLLSLALFSVSGYVGAMAMGAFEFYGYYHSLIVSLYAPVVLSLRHTLWITITVLLVKEHSSKNVFLFLFMPVFTIIV